MDIFSRDGRPAPRVRSPLVNRPSGGEAPRFHLLFDSGVRPGWRRVLSALSAG